MRMPQSFEEGHSQVLWLFRTQVVLSARMPGWSTIAGVRLPTKAWAATLLCRCAGRLDTRMCCQADSCTVRLCNVKWQYASMLVTSLCSVNPLA